MPRIACVHIPALPLQLLLRSHPDWRGHPAAVVDRDKAQGTLLWVNEAARRLRILPGMRYAAGLSLSRELRAGTVAPAEIDAGVEELLTKLRFYSAEVEPAEEPGVFWLDANGLHLLYPSLHQWAELIHRDLREACFVNAVAVGFSRFGSHAAARALGVGVRSFTEPLEEETATRDLPLERLGFDPRLRDALDKLGVRTLGAFLELPADGLRRRFGKQVHELHRLARGDLWSPLQPKPVTEPVERSLGLDYAETDATRLLVLVEDLLRGLLPELASRRQGLTACTLRLRMEDAAPREEILKPAAPTLDREQILELVRLRLEGIDLASGVVELGLHLEGVTAPQDQLDLFAENPHRNPQAAARAFARLRAEFGEDTVRRAHLREGHLPEARFAWERMDELPRARPVAVQRPPLVRRFLPRPVALSRQRRNEPDGWLITGLENGPVEEIMGPYILSGGWWQREVHREYHFIRTRHGGWLWVFFDRRRRRWFLHGTVE